MEDIEFIDIPQDVEITVEKQDAAVATENSSGLTQANSKQNEDPLMLLLAREQDLIAQESARKDRENAKKSQLDEIRLRLLEKIISKKD